MIKTDYFRDTVWTSNSRKEALRVFPEEVYDEDERLGRLDRTIERAALCQISEILGETPKFYADNHGTLQVEFPSETSPEVKTRVYRIFEAYRSGYYRRHQFRDFTGNQEYAQWFKQSKELYLHTMPLKQIFSLSDWDKNGVYTKELENTLTLHNKEDELCRAIDGFQGYNISQFKGILECYLEPYVMLYIIGKDVHIEEFDGIPYVVCTTPRKAKLAVSMFNKSIYRVNGDKLEIIGNAYEFLFKRLEMPISTILNSVLHVIDPYKLPGEGMGPYTLDRRVQYGVDDAIKSSGYDEARKMTKKSYFYEW